MTKKRAAKTTKSAGRRVPVLRVHKQSQRCYGTFSGQEIWFGARTDPETQKRFDAYLAEWLARGRKLEQVRDESLTIRSLAARYLIHLEAEHDAAWRRNNAARMKYALDALLKLHGPTLAKDYGPLKLKALREHIASAKRRDGSPRLSVGTINERIQIVRNAFQWAVSEEIVPAAIIEGLRVAVGEVHRGLHRTNFV